MGGLPAEETVSKSRKLGVASAAVVALCHASISLCRCGVGRGLGCSFPEAGTISCFPDGICSLVDHHLLVDLSFRVHHQDARDQWCCCNSWRADRIFLLRCLGQSCLWSSDLGHRQREVQARRGGLVGLSWQDNSLPDIIFCQTWHFSNQIPF